MSDFAQVFDLARILETSDQMPVEYCLLSDTSRLIILQLLTGEPRYMWKWLNDGEKLTESEWDDALALVDLAVWEVISTMLTGTILEWSLPDIPDGFYLCDGSEIDRTEKLGDLLVTAGCPYGVGDGSTTVNLPDKQGRVSVGLDELQSEFDTLGEVGGEKSHTLIVSEMPAHTHTEVVANAAVINGGLEAPAAAATPAASVTGSTGGNGAHNNLQPYLVTNFIIKA